MSLRTRGAQVQHHRGCGAITAASGVESTAQRAARSAAASTAYCVRCKQAGSRGKRSRASSPAGLRQGAGYAGRDAPRPVVRSLGAKNACIS